MVFIEACRRYSRDVLLAYQHSKHGYDLGYMWRGVVRRLHLRRRGRHNHHTPIRIRTPAVICYGQRGEIIGNRVYTDIDQLSQCHQVSVLRHLH